MIDNLKKVFLIAFIGLLFFIILNTNTFAYMIANYSEGAFGGDGEDSSTIDTFIVEGAGYFLKSYRDILLLLRRVEVSGTSGLDANEIGEIIDRSLANMTRAAEAYAALAKKAENTPYNEYVVSRLITFDYLKFQKEKGLNTSIFKKVKRYLENGDARGIYYGLLAKTGKILNLLHNIKSSLDKGNFPIVSKLWRLNQQFTDALLFGQYISEIFWTMKRK